MCVCVCVGVVLVLLCDVGDVLFVDWCVVFGLCLLYVW